MNDFYSNPGTLRTIPVWGASSIASCRWEEASCLKTGNNEVTVD